MNLAKCGESIKIKTGRAKSGLVPEAGQALSPDMPAIFSALHVNMPHAASIHASAARIRAATSGSELISSLTIECFSEMKPLFRFIMLGLAWSEAGTPLARSCREAKIPIFEKADEVCYHLLTLELYQ